MRSLGKAKQLSILAVIVSGIVMLGACSGGGGGVSGPVQLQPTTSTARTISLALPQSGVSKAALPSVGGFSETISFPANNAASGTTLTLAISTRVPAGMPVLAPGMEVTQPFLYLALSSNHNVTLQNYPGFSMTLPSSVPLNGSTIMMGFYDPANGWKYVGNLTLLGSTATFTPSGSTNITLNAGVNYYAITYRCGAPTPTPTPTSAATTEALPAPGTTAPIPPAGGYTGSFVVGANNAPPGTTVTLTTYVGLPTGAPSPEAVIRKIDTVHMSPLLAKAPSADLSVKETYSTPDPTTEIKPETSDGSTITFAKFPAVSFGLPSDFNTSGLTFKLETFDLTTDTLLDLEIGTLSDPDTQVSFPGTDTTDVVNTGHTYLLELVTESGQPTPTPSPDVLYVTNFDSNTITEYTQSGSQVSLSEGAFPNLNGPQGIVFDDSNDDLYVTNLGPEDEGPFTITEYALNGNQLSPSGKFPNLDEAFGLAFDPLNDEIYAPNTGNNTMTVYDQNGDELPLSEGAFPNLDDPQSVVFDPLNGELYAPNNGNNTMTVYNKNGSQVSLSEGAFPNLNVPTGVTLDPLNGHLYVSNGGNNTVTVYDQNGNQIATTGTFPHLDVPIDIAFDPSNSELYVINDGNNSMTVYDQNGNQITTTGTFPNLNEPEFLVAAP
jgi:DNA-binding beta-propeller fold protein YncE